MRPGLMLTLGAALLLGVLTLFLFQVLEDAEQVTAPRRPDVSLSQSGRPAPDFALRTFDGRSLRLSDYRGNVVLLNFWASWCTPCKQEMPNLQRLWTEYEARGVVVLGVDVRDDPDDALTFLRTYQITYPNVYDPGQDRMTAYQITALPTTIFMDRQLRIRGRVAGGYLGDAGYRDLQRQVERLLALP